MLKKIIANFSLFVISALSITMTFTGCAFVSTSADPSARESKFLPPTVIGEIKSADITESSGLAASRCQTDVFWTHNDSGDEAFIFALDATGANLGTWKIPNAENTDWEDIAAYKDIAGKCFIYIGDIGDNKAKRREHMIYRLQEPIVVPANASSSRKEPLTPATAESLRFSYPDSYQDAETLMVHPKTGDIYIVTKHVSGPAGVYRLSSDFDLSTVQKAERVAEIAVPAVPNGFLTGGDISPDGRHLVVCDYTRAYEFSLPDGDENFAEIWKQIPDPIEIGKRKGGESIAYGVDGTAIFATSEGRNSPVIEVRRRN